MLKFLNISVLFILLAFGWNRIALAIPDGAGNEVFPSVNVGIGTTSPQAAFVVTNGNVGIGTWTAAGGRLIVNGGGNVGIGSVWPGQVLDVQGTVRSIGLTLTTGASTGYVLQTNSVGVGTWVSPSTIVSAGGSPSGGQNAVQYNSSSAFAGSEAVFSFNGTNVGIGTTNGVQVLDVRTTASMAMNVGIGTTATGIAARLAVIGGNIGLGTITPQTALAVANGNVGIGTWTAGGGNLIVNGGGNVGIGSAWPGAMLDVAGSFRANGSGDNYMTGNVGLGSLAPTQALDVSGSGVISANFGVGTTTPQAKLAVLGNVGIGTWTASSGLQLRSSFAVYRTATAASVSSAGQTIIGVTNTGAARTITLATADMAAGRIVLVKDESGGAGTNNITIDTQGAETIDGQNSVTISANYGVLRAYSDGSNWFTF